MSRQRGYAALNTGGEAMTASCKEDLKIVSVILLLFLGASILFPFFVVFLGKCVVFLGKWFKFVFDIFS